VAVPTPRSSPKTRKNGSTSQLFGPEIGLARQLYADTGKTAEIVKVAHEGSSLAGDWSPNGGDLGMYATLVNKVTSVIAADAAVGCTDVIGGFFWF
jgi:hypothetical protein